MQELEHWQIDRLIEYARNPRKNDHAVDRVAAAIREFGFRVPILAKSDGTIIDGHLRWKSAKKLGMETVPVMLADDMTDTQIKAFRLSVNKISELAEWDNDLLAIELEELNIEGFDLDLTGFTLEEIEGLVPEVEVLPGLTDEDAVPDVPEDPVTKLGDVWLCGKHRVMCGDSTSIDAVEKLLDGQKADMVFTDPPYGMSYGGGRARGDHAKNKNGGVLIKAHGMIIGDDLEGDALLKMVADSVGNAASAAKEGAAAYVCFTWRTYSEFHAALQSVGVNPKACIVWDKKRIGLGNSNYRPQHEFIFYCGGQWYGDKSQSDIWGMSRGATGKYVHPTQKPVELIEKAILNSSKKGDAIHDCFGGSGSTMIGAEQTGRNAYLMELDPKYCDVIVTRWQAFTGKQATLESTGQTFDELCQD